MEIKLGKVKDRISGKVIDLVFVDRDQSSWYLNYEHKGIKVSFIVYHKDIKRLVKSI